MSSQRPASNHEQQQLAFYLPCRHGFPQLRHSLDEGDGGEEAACNPSIYLLLLLLLGGRAKDCLSKVLDGRATPSSGPSLHPCARCSTTEVQKTKRANRVGDLDEDGLSSAQICPPRAISQLAISISQKIASSPSESGVRAASLVLHRARLGMQTLRDGCLLAAIDCQPSSLWYSSMYSMGRFFTISMDTGQILCPISTEAPSCAWQGDKSSPPSHCLSALQDSAPNDLTPAVTRLRVTVTRAGGTFG
ncbi:hypothetical protein CC78DRAFT_574551 [Lojkania enalia]|uniref:Uncharacterized protein n=1 Tax=Lojkania enalia TaxID=147567 RepID=A0A9P4NAK5_9PLEO|nr:hypothetical protein CC78DRAFT_574551 [Didymosphaeria enalia]